MHLKYLVKHQVNWFLFWKIYKWELGGALNHERVSLEELEQVVIKYSPI